MGYGKTGSNMPSIALSKPVHRNYTNLWRQELRYKMSYKEKRILQTAIEIYSHNPELLGAAIYAVVKNKL